MTPAENMGLKTAQEQQDEKDAPKKVEGIITDKLKDFPASDGAGDTRSFDEIHDPLAQKIKALDERLDRASNRQKQLQRRIQPDVQAQNAKDNDFLVSRLENLRKKHRAEDIDPSKGSRVFRQDGLVKPMTEVVHAKGASASGEIDSAGDLPVLDLIGPNGDTVAQAMADINVRMDSSKPHPETASMMAELKAMPAPEKQESESKQAIREMLEMSKQELTAAPAREQQAIKEEQERHKQQWEQEEQQKNVVLDELKNMIVARENIKAELTKIANKGWLGRKLSSGRKRDLEMSLQDVEQQLEGKMIQHSVDESAIDKITDEVNHPDQHLVDKPQDNQTGGTMGWFRRNKLGIGLAGLLGIAAAKSGDMAMSSNTTPDVSQNKPNVMTIDKQPDKPDIKDLMPKPDLRPPTPSEMPDTGKVAPSQPSSTELGPMPVAPGQEKDVKPPTVGEIDAGLQAKPGTGEHAPEPDPLTKKGFKKVGTEDSFDNAYPANTVDNTAAKVPQAGENLPPAETLATAGSAVDDGEDKAPDQVEDNRVAKDINVDNLTPSYLHNQFMDGDSGEYNKTALFQAGEKGEIIVNGEASKDGNAAYGEVVKRLKEISKLAQQNNKVDGDKKISSLKMLLGETNFSKSFKGDVWDNARNMVTQ